MAAARAKRFDGDGNALPQTRFGYAGGYSTVDNERMNGIAEGVEALTDRECRVLLWFVANTPGADLPVEKPVPEIARRLKMDPKSLKRHIEKLEGMRLLRPGKVLGRYTFWKVTPYLCFQAGAAEQREALKAWNPPEIPAWVEPQPKTRKTRSDKKTEEEG
ncbi:helix-turn-helix transcriptional regulator [Kitasatospora sp. NPDC001574]